MGHHYLGSLEQHKDCQTHSRSAKNDLQMACTMRGLPERIEGLCSSFYVSLGPERDLSRSCAVLAQGRGWCTYQAVNKKRYISIGCPSAPQRCDDSPFFVIKRCEDYMDTCFHASTSLGSACDFAFEGSYHILSLHERSDWVTEQASHMDLTFDGHRTKTVTG